MDVYLDSSQFRVLENGAVTNSLVDMERVKGFLRILESSAVPSFFSFFLFFWATNQLPNHDMETSH